MHSSTKVLITGTDGFIGSGLLEETEFRGYACLGTRLDETTRRNTVSLDVTDDTAVSKVFSAFAPDLVIHCAAVTSPPTTDSLAVEKGRLWEVNVGGTQKVIRASMECGAARFVFLSSEAVYGPVPTPNRSVERTASLDRIWHEEAPLRGTGDYALAKIDAEELCRSHQSDALRVSVVRLGTVYGSNERATSHRERVSIPHQLVALARGNSVIRLRGRDCQRSYLDIRDVSRLVLSLGLHRSPKHTVYNLGGDRLVTFCELAELVEKLAATSDQSVTLEWVRGPSSVDLEMASSDARALMDTSRLAGCIGPMGFRPLADGIEALFART